jgi:hypothetical protein
VNSGTDTTSEELALVTRTRGYKKKYSDRTWATMGEFESLMNRGVVLSSEDTVFWDKHIKTLILKRRKMTRYHILRKTNCYSPASVSLIGCSTIFMLGVSTTEWRTYLLESWNTRCQKSGHAPCSSMQELLDKPDMHIDEIIPCYAFDIRCPNDMSVLLHHQNSQVLTAADNLSKGSK